MPPPVKPPTVGDALKPAAKITGGVLLGVLAGFFVPVLAAMGGTLFEVPHGRHATDPAVVGCGLAGCVAVIAIVPLLWRRGLRGTPIGLCLGVALPTLLLAACAADSL